MKPYREPVAALPRIERRDMIVAERVAMPPISLRLQSPLRRSKRGIGKAIRRLISRHNPKRLPAVSDLEGLIRVLSSLNSNERRSVSVSVVKGSGKAVYMTEELAQTVASQKEFFACEIESR